MTATCWVCGVDRDPPPVCTFDCLNDSPEHELADHYERTQHD